MSSKQPQQRQQTPNADGHGTTRTFAEANVAHHEGVVLMRVDGQLGHRAVYVRLPESVARKYQVREEAPELKSIVLQRLARWIAGIR